MEEAKYYVQDAVRDLRAAGLDAEKRAYGFLLVHQDTLGKYTAECGSEHDWSITLPLKIEGWGGVRWFVRYSVREMAEFLISGLKRVQNGEPDSFLAALEFLDEKYDKEDMDQRLTALRKAHGCEY